MVSGAGAPSIMREPRPSDYNLFNSRDRPSEYVQGVRPSIVSNDGTGFVPLHESAETGE